VDQFELLTEVESPPHRQQEQDPRLSPVRLSLDNVVGSRSQDRTAVLVEDECAMHTTSQLLMSEQPTSQVVNCNWESLSQSKAPTYVEAGEYLACQDELKGTSDRETSTETGISLLSLQVEILPFCLTDGG
jgi:hypothetical protein